MATSTPNTITPYMPKLHIQPITMAYSDCHMTQNISFPNTVSVSISVIYLMPCVIFLVSTVTKVSFIPNGLLIALTTHNTSAELSTVCNATYSVSVPICKVPSMAIGIGMVV